MSRGETLYYLDTSALVKRYVEERGSDVVDNVFNECYQGMSRIALSYWNIAEAAGVFDKYGKRLGLDAKKLLRNLLREIRVMARLHRVIVVELSPRILRRSIDFVLKYHIYVADALQIASAHRASANIFVTGDKSLARIAEREGFKAVYVG